MSKQETPEVYVTVAPDYGLRTSVCAGCGVKMPGYPLDDVSEWCFACVQAGKNR